MGFKIWKPAVLVTALSAAAFGSCPIKPDEDLRFFPAYGVRQEDGTWRLEVHAWLYEPETDSVSRAALLKALESRLPESKAHEDSPLFKERTRPFLRDGERDKVLTLRLNGREIDLPPSLGSGHIHARLELPSSLEGSVEFSVGPCGGRTFAGTAPLLPPEGLTVVSDIDDTVKVSEVRDKRRLLARTFLEPFEAAPGMAALYRRWEGKGAAFHYLSAGPWQMQEVLGDFLRKESFPSGTFGMKEVRAKDRTLLDLFSEPDMHKRRELEKLLSDFPRRRFILVGDDGERDPEIYADIARRHAGRVERILIRRVTEDAPSRFESAFEGVPVNLWLLFRDPSEIKE